MNRVIILLLLCFLFLAGCASKTVQVVPLNSRQVSELSADDMVRLMLRAGFTDKQILDSGPKVRNSLALFGASRLVVDQDVEAVFAVQNGHVHVSTRGHGTFAYDTKTGQFF